MLSQDYGLIILLDNFTAVKVKSASLESANFKFVTHFALKLRDLCFDSSEQIIKNLCSQKEGELIFCAFFEVDSGFEFGSNKVHTLA